MKKVEMSEAGLTLLLNRAESTLDLWEIVWSNTGEAPHAHYRDLAEASREARDRLGMPPRELWKTRQRSTPEPEGAPDAEAPRRRYVCWRYEGALQRQAKAILERAVALENRYPDGPITDPVDAGLIEALLARAAAIERLLEDAEANRHFVPDLLPAWEMPPPTATELRPAMQDGC